MRTTDGDRPTKNPDDNNDDGGDNDSMQISIADRLTPQSGGGSAAAPLVPFSVVDASRALPGEDGYVFPVKSATIKVAPGVPSDAVISALRAEPDVKSVHPNTLMSIAQGACACVCCCGGSRVCVERVFFVACF